MSRCRFDDVGVVLRYLQDTSVEVLTIRCAY